MNMPTTIKVEPREIELKPDKEVEEIIKDLYIAGYIRDPKINEYTTKYWQVHYKVHEYDPAFSFDFTYEGQLLFSKYILVPENSISGPKHFPPRDASLLSTGLTLHVDLNKKGPYYPRNKED